MIKQWVKRDKYQSFIPMGSYTKNGKTTSVNAFYMSPTEVTNLEYRTFMFDLLQQGRKEDYLKVKPDPSQWLKMYPKYNAPMEKMYFAHPAYNLYPVNNIPRVGAQIYCLWLTEIVNAYLNEKKKAEIAVIRIPLDTEWEHAATGHNENYKYPWGGPYTRNSKGCYLANFNPDGEQPNDDGAMHTAAVSSYSPNDYGLYCMSGNVAEMVVNSADSTIGTKGGGFLSSSEEMVIDAPIQNIGVDSAQMDIGFRVVCTYLKINGN
jgi:formylglycine-generating enzyme required for sulfatase activity